MKQNHVDLILLDIRLPKMDGMEVLKKTRKLDENIMVIMITAVRDMQTAVKAMKLGAYDYISKPFDAPELRVLVSKALEKRNLIKENTFLHSEIARISEYDRFVGKSPQMKFLLKLIGKAAASSSAVLIHGESGTGKELVAREIHSRSSRSNKAFVAINCAGIPDNLLESELFGHEAGAYTGAMERRQGKFELADGGTIFLDEIGSMSLHLQSKLLRVLQEKGDGSKEIERLGSSRPISVDVRVISATNMDLKKLIENGKFREDLYYRLNVLPVNVPPLRDRIKDIKPLVDYFLDKINRNLAGHITGFDKKAMDVLTAYSWPGNIRELKNLVEREVSLKQEGKVSVTDLPVEILINRARKNGYDNSMVSSRVHMEKKLIEKALLETRGNQVKASRLLGIHRNTMRAKIRQLNIKNHEIPPGSGSIDPGVA